MKTETEVAIQVGHFRAADFLSNEPDGFKIKIFLACSRTTTKVFKLKGEITPIAQNLKIRNIAGKELEFWLCNNRNKIIVLPLLFRQMLYCLSL